ncbi:nucleoside monophosphate kinase [Patescibacteria group bacterium]|nr:nucleoside monophosphate kinase [Patescibacteria group bacterium]MBU1034512.1 nucleoside monophosphate kinase [Patescibacteria group bacterium]MBU1629502.1 nucleoside monophosphate kinase [Patescibacteria group bacterium]MBU1907862.1 nucleoside monophosphate kinase [Patescibacteria group bacterium]
MPKKYLRATLFGPQGCGKGTQGQLLADRFDVPLIGVGEMFRREILANTNLGKLAKKYVEGGALAPDELTNGIVGNQLRKTDLSKGFILDGYPRNVEQAMHIDRVAKLNLAVQIKISDKEAVRRLTGRVQCTACSQVYHLKDAPPIRAGICVLCGGRLVRRDDDTEELILNRLANYHFMTEPLMTYYRQRGILLSINGEQAIPYVFEGMIKKLSKLGFKP